MFGNLTCSGLKPIHKQRQRIELGANGDLDLEFRVAEGQYMFFNECFDALLCKVGVKQL